jgi:predicted transposase/invertase (TIGR01784 family)
VPEEQIRAAKELIRKKEGGGMFDQFVESYLESKRLAREEGRVEGREEGRMEGRQEGLIEIARNALSEGVSVEVVRKITGLDLETLGILP